MRVRTYLRMRNYIECKTKTITAPKPTLQSLNTHLLKATITRFAFGIMRQTLSPKLYSPNEQNAYNGKHNIICSKSLASSKAEQEWEQLRPRMAILCSAFWSKPIVEEFLTRRNFRLTAFDGCMYGLQPRLTSVATFTHPTSMEVSVQ